MNTTRNFAASRGRRHTPVGLLLIPITTMALLLVTACEDSIATPELTPVANRAPEARGEIQPQSVNAGTEAQVDVSPFFVDPDGDELTFTVESSDAAVATANVAGNVVSIRGVTDGMATITVTGADADGLRATQTIQATVGPASTVLREEFESEQSLSRWRSSQAGAVVASGRLWLTNHSGTEMGRVVRNLLAPLDSDWSIAVRMGRADQGVTPALFLRTTDAPFPLYRLDIGPTMVNDEPVNYWFGVFDVAKGSWTVLASGTSEAIDDAPGQLTEIELVFNGGRYHAEAGTALLFEGTAAGWMPTTVASVWLAGRAATGATGVTSLFDWIEVDGRTDDSLTGFDPTIPLDHALSNHIW